MSSNINGKPIFWNTRTKLHLAITLAVMIFIFVQSAMPGEISGAESNLIVRFLSDLTGIEAESLSMIVRKAAHFTEFMILGICLAINVKDISSVKVKPLNPFGMWLMPWLIGTVYAITDEIHQLFVPERACAFMDMCIDACGVAVGAMIVVGVVRGKGRL